MTGYDHLFKIKNIIYRRDLIYAFFRKKENIIKEIVDFYKKIRR